MLFLFLLFLFVNVFNRSPFFATRLPYDPVYTRGQSLRALFAGAEGDRRRNFELSHRSRYLELDYAGYHDAGRVVPVVGSVLGIPRGMRFG
jgi:hypothetical protein